MPKKIERETAEQQSERFKRDAQKLIDADELNPTEADKAFDRVMYGVARKRQEWLGDEQDQETPP